MPQGILFKGPSSCWKLYTWKIDREGFLWKGLSGQTRPDQRVEGQSLCLIPMMVSTDKELGRPQVFEER